jgi:hypothetical protein
MEVGGKQRDRPFIIIRQAFYNNKNGKAVDMGVRLSILLVCGRDDFWPHGIRRS